MQVHLHTYICMSIEHTLERLWDERKRFKFDPKLVRSCSLESCRPHFWTFYRGCTRGGGGRVVWGSCGGNGGEMGGTRPSDGEPLPPGRYGAPLVTQPPQLRNSHRTNTLLILYNLYNITKIQPDNKYMSRIISRVIVRCNLLRYFREQYTNPEK